MLQILNDLQEDKDNLKVVIDERPKPNMVVFNNIKTLFQLTFSFHVFEAIIFKSCIQECM